MKVMERRSVRIQLRDGLVSHLLWENRGRVRTAAAFHPATEHGDQFSHIHVADDHDILLVESFQRPASVQDVGGLLFGDIAELGIILDAVAPNGEVAEAFLNLGQLFCGAWILIGFGHL